MVIECFKWISGSEVGRSQNKVWINTYPLPCKGRVLIHPFDPDHNYGIDPVLIQF